MNEAIIF
jgi:hypothetical protein